MCDTYAGMRGMIDYESRNEWRMSAEFEYHAHSANRASSEKGKSTATEQKNVAEEGAQCKSKRMKKLRRHGDIGIENHGQTSNGLTQGRRREYTGHGIHETGVGGPRLMLHSLDKWRIDGRRFEPRGKHLRWSMVLGRVA